MLLSRENVGLGDIILDRGGNLETRFEAHCAIPEGREVSDLLAFPEVTPRIFKARIRALEGRHRKP